MADESTRARLDRVLSAALYAALAMFVIVATHNFFAYIGHYPYWSIDDGLSVVSTSWLQTGHYGDPSVPVEGFSDRQRFRGFFIYGPWPFAAGSAMTWLFGFSVPAMRALHLLAALSLVFVASRLFAGLRGAIATTALGAAVCYTVVQIEWPMVRPDIFVTLFAGLMVWRAALALRHDGVRYWFGCGLAAGCGALSHLVGASLVLASLVSLVGGVAARGPLTITRVTRPAAALVAGWLVSAVVFYASFGFRVTDHFQHLLQYRTTVLEMSAVAFNSSSPWVVWNEHFRIASSGVGNVSIAAVVLALMAGIWLVGRALWRKDETAVETVAVILPGVSVFVLYVLSLGFYPNFHTGYVILPQLMGLWVVASVTYVLLVAAGRGLGAGARVLEVAAAVIVILAVARSGYALAANSADDPRIALTRSWIAISEYVDEVLGPLPKRAIAWGAAPFAAEGPERIQLISLETALWVMSHIPAERRTALAPDYLVWGHPQSQDAMANPFIAANQEPLQLLRAVLPDADFTLASIVAGAPYGATRVYQRRLPESAAAPLPTVSVWDSAQQQWLHHTTAVDGIVWNAASGSVRVAKGPQHWNWQATSAVTAELPAGWYLLRVAVSGDPRRPQLITAANGIAHDYIVGDLPPPIDVAPRLADEPIYLLQRHDGGTLGLNLLSVDPGAGLSLVETFRISGLADYRVARELLAEQPLPALSAWLPDAPSGVTAVPQGDRLDVAGNASAWGYQLVSPSIEVTPGAAVTVRVPVTIQAGRVCTGVLDERQQQWIVRPLERADVHRFQAGTNRAFFIVVSNCNGDATPAVASRFTLGPGQYAVFADRWYVETLMREFASAPR